MRMLSYLQDLIVISLLVLRSIPIIQGHLSHIAPFRPNLTQNASLLSIMVLRSAKIQVAPNMFSFKRYLRNHFTGGSDDQ